MSLENGNYWKKASLRYDDQIKSNGLTRFDPKTTETGESHENHENHEKKGKLNVIKALFFVSGENAGGALLALPFAMAGCGWFGLGLIFILGLDAGLAGLVLAKSWLLLEEKCPDLRGNFRYPYPAIGLKTFGPKMRVVVSICMHITCFGSCIVLLILCSEIVYNLTNAYLGICFCHWIIIVALVLCPLMWLGTPGEFWPAAAAAITTTSLAVILILWEVIVDYTSMDNDEPVDYPTPIFKSVFLAFGTIMFAYGGTAGFPTFQNDMNDRSKFKYSIMFGFLVLFLLYLPTSGLGYITYGGTVNNDLFLSLKRHSPQKIIAEVLLAIHLFCGFLLLFNPSAQEIEDLIGIPKKFNWKRVAIRVFLHVIIVFIAESVPNFGKLLNLVGGSAIAMLSYILPPLFYLKIHFDNSPSWREMNVSLKYKFVLIQIMIIGAAGGIACTYSALIEIFSPSAFTTPCYLNSSFYHL